MKAVIDINRSSRARKVRFQLPDGCEIVVSPITVDQAIECLSLDPEQGSAETPLDELIRLRRQARAVLGKEHGDLSATLDKWQLGQIIGTLYISACGMDAEAYAEWQAGQRRSSQRRKSLEMLAELEDLSATLAASLRRLPAEVGAQPLADLIALQKNLEAQRKADLQFQAAIHNKKLT